MSDLEEMIRRIVRSFEAIEESDCKHFYAGWCYVVSSSNEHVKIGSTKTTTVGRLIGRLGEIQALCPTPISLLRLYVGGRGLEKALHRQLAKHRLHGEWFSSLAIADLPFTGCPTCDMCILPGGIHPEDLALLRGPQ